MGSETPFPCVTSNSSCGPLIMVVAFRYCFHACPIDKSKYGFRMLQQMGWKEGKGLGANEDGDTTHVRISKKQDNSGE